MAPAGDPRVQGSGLEIDPSSGSASVVVEDRMEVDVIKSGGGVGLGRRVDRYVSANAS
jgi:hypothetical protein